MCQNINFSFPKGLVSLVGEEDKAKPIRVVRDTRNSQSLLEGVFPLSDQSYTGSEVLNQGVGSPTCC